MCEDWLSQDFSYETWEKHKKDFLPFKLFNELKNQRFEFITDVYEHKRYVCIQINIEWFRKNRLY